MRGRKEIARVLGGDEGKGNEGGSDARLGKRRRR